MSRTGAKPKQRHDVERLAATFGYDVSTTSGGHLRLRKPGRPTVHHSSTASDRRALLNLRAQLRRADQQRTRR
jgi:hypothetical protein